MGWHATDVDGKVMWESPDGQRVADVHDIPGNSKPASGPRQTVYVSHRASWWFGFIAGLWIGMLITGGAVAIATGSFQ